MRSLSISLTATNHIRMIPINTMWNMLGASGFKDVVIPSEVIIPPYGSAFIVAAVLVSNPKLCVSLSLEINVCTFPVD